MKRCPTCQKTFDESLRFCQFDGTLLVDDFGTNAAGLPVDPLKTIVGGAPIRDDEDDILRIGDNINRAKTLISNPDLQSAKMSLDEFKDDAPASSFDDFSSTQVNSNPFSNESASSNASPFDVPNYQSPAAPFNEPMQTKPAETSFNQNPFDNAQNQFGQPLQPSAWTPPPAPEASWQSQNIGANTPFQPPVAAGFGQDKTLAIVSLVCGILSLTCCGPVTGIAALITGYMAKNNVDANPQQYDGRGMAIAGMIMGGISLILTVLYFIFVGLFGFLR